MLIRSKCTPDSFISRQRPISIISRPIVCVWEISSPTHEHEHDGVLHLLRLGCKYYSGRIGVRRPCLPKLKFISDQLMRRHGHGGAWRVSDLARDDSLSSTGNPSLSNTLFPIYYSMISNMYISRFSLRRWSEEAMTIWGDVEWEYLCGGETADVHPTENLLIIVRKCAKPMLVIICRQLIFIVFYDVFSFSLVEIVHRIASVPLY